MRSRRLASCSSRSSASTTHSRASASCSSTVQLIQKHLNPQLRVSTILLTMYDGRTRLAQQVAEEVREHFPKEVLTTVIPRSVRVSEAPSFGQTVIAYDGQSAGALAYLEAAVEIMQRGRRARYRGES